MQSQVLAPRDLLIDVLDRRRSQGLDRFDEVWEGVHHMVPPPSFDHQQRSGRLYRRLAELLDGTDLGVAFETGLFDPARPDADYLVWADNALILR